jgi:hypothetical protein
MTAMNDAAWLAFEEACRRRDAERRHTLIPVLGTGFSAQARKRLDWRDLLVRIAGDLALELRVPQPEEIAGNTTLVWEAMLTEIAAARNLQPAKAEVLLSKHVAKVVAAEFPPGGATRELAERITSARFRDVISFNFDLGLHTHPPRFVRSAPRSFDPVWDHAIHEESEARVWYPHGCVVDALSLQLGQRNYGLLIPALERARAHTKQAEKAGRAPRPSWVGVGLTRPLVFLGMSLGREEWALWWFLNQRRRNSARQKLESSRPVFVLIQAREAEVLRVAAELAGLTLLVFPNGAFNDAWERVLGCFAQ